MHMALLLAHALFLAPVESSARYVFLFVGDGMGLAQVSLAEAYQASISGDTLGFAPVSFTTFPVFGTSTTHCANRRITESSAAGTALATGSKAGDGTLGTEPGTRRKLPNIATEARAAGRKVAILSTVSIDHATPAAFYAQADDRNAYNAIAMQLPRSGYDIFAGSEFLKPVGDSGNVWNALRDAGYDLVRGRSELARRKPGRPFMALPVATNGTATVPWEIDRSPRESDQPTLADFVRESARLMEGDPQGFFLMAEAGKIDWAGHANDARSAIGEVQALDSAVRVALDFARRHPGQVLIVVTADHETGGLSLGNGTLRYQTNFGLLRHQISSKDALTDSLRHVLGTSDSLSAFEGALLVIGRRTGLGRAPELALTNAERGKLSEAWAAERAKPARERGETLATTAIALLNARAGVGWATGAHTAQPVPTYAWGVGADAFAGRLDNTDIPRKLRKAMGLDKRGPTRGP